MENYKAVRSLIEDYQVHQNPKLIKQWIAKKTPDELLYILKQNSLFISNHLPKAQIFLDILGESKKFKEYSKKSTPLIAAIFALDAPCVIEAIIKAGGNVQESNEDTNTLILACKFNPEVIPVLLKYGANPNMTEPTSGNTPLLQICQFGGSVKDMKQLIKAGANIELADPMENTPLLHLVRNSDKHYNAMQLIKTLIKAGANLNCENHWEKTPLNAAIYDKPKIVKLLLQSGADIHYKNKSGKTVLELMSNVTGLHRAETLAILKNHLAQIENNNLTQSFDHKFKELTSFQKSKKSTL